jgi:hypothetical protein
MFNRIAGWFSGAAFCALFAASVACAAPPTTVAIAGEVSGVDPFPLVIRVAARARGANPDELSGGGYHVVLSEVDGFIEESNWNVWEGDTDGTSVSFSATIWRSKAPIVGTPITLDADASTGALIFSIGPFTGGAFVGETFVFEGFGTVVINNP